jgi:hypothetical protein
MARVFQSVIEEMLRHEQCVSTPRSFQTYLSEIGIKASNTPTYISVQSFDDLKPELKENHLMVFRLGKSTEDSGTQFALAKYSKDWSDFFIFDDAYLDKAEDYGRANLDSSKLLAYRLLPSFTETSIVNFCIAAGLFNRVCHLNEDQLLAPATGNSTYSFDFLPTVTSKNSLAHRNGQVEIDAIFNGKRRNKDIIIVVEAKVSKKVSSLPKHKLVYPVLAIAQKIPTDFDIVPIYLRAVAKPGGFHLYFLECEIPDPRDSLISIDSLKVKRTSHIELKL